MFLSFIKEKISSLGVQLLAALFIMMIVSCSNKDNGLRPVASQGMNATQGVNKACINKLNCEPVDMVFGGVSRLGGSEGQFLSWNIEAKSKEDPERRYNVYLFNLEQSKQENMEIRSAEGDEKLLINWKPLKTMQVNIEIIARDYNRCMMFEDSQISCTDMSKYMKDYDIITSYPVEVVEAGEIFNAAESEFFRSFACDGISVNKYGENYLENKFVNFTQRTLNNVASGDTVINSAASAAAEDGDIYQNIAQITDYLANEKDRKPTEFECFKENTK